MKTLSEKQIERLYEFTREHYVDHYDLQTELVDHLANAIEKRWEETPEMDFEDCIKAEFKKFGIFGFMDVVEKRQKALRKKYKKLIWGQVVDFFQLPKILLTGGLTFLLYFIVQSEIMSIELFVVFWILLIVFITTYLYKLRKKYKRKVEVTGRRWVLEDMIFGVATIPAVLSIVMQIVIQAPIQHWKILNPYLIFIICLGVVILGILTYVSLNHLPNNAEKYLSETYPEYQLVEKA